MQLIPHFALFCGMLAAQFLASTLSPSVIQLRAADAASWMFRGAYFHLMAEDHPGFRLDGNADGTPGSPFFFGKDTVHPWEQSYRFLTNLAQNFMVQVRSDFFGIVL